MLYSQIAIDGNDTALQEMVDGIVTHFEQSGLLTKETPRVKLHVSMIRSKGDAGAVACILEIRAKANI